MLENGYKLNEIYEMDLYYFMELMLEDKKPKQSNSFFDLLG